jgi:hypothetical protein
MAGAAVKRVAVAMMPSAIFFMTVLLSLPQREKRIKKCAVP